MSVQKGSIIEPSSSAGLPYTLWAGQVSQAGTAAPTAVEMYNNTGAVVTFVRDAVGAYRMQGFTFTEAKINATIQPQYLLLAGTTFASIRDVIIAANESDQNIYISTKNTTGVGVDAVLTNFYLEIKIYP